MINNYQKIYKNKIKLLIEIMNNFYEYGKAYNEIHKDLLIKTERYIQFINIRQDMEYFIQDMNYLNENKRRFLNEQFLDYEIIKKNIDKNENDKEIKNNINVNVDKLININTNNSNLTHNITYEKSLQILEFGKKDNEKINIESEENKKIDSYIKELLESENELSRDKYIYLIQYMDKNNQNISIFMDLLIYYYKGKKFITIKNFENLKLLSNILCLLVSYSFNKKINYEVCFYAIFISEKTIYYNKDNYFNKYYLCKYLSNNKIFSSINFWTELINIYINMMADVLTRKEIEKREKIKEYNQNSGMFNKVINIFAYKKDIENQKIENEILYEQIYNQQLPNYCVKVIDKYLNHFSHFNLEHTKVSELIVDMSIKYKFDYSYVTYFLSKLNSNLYINFTKKNIEKRKITKTINKKIDYNELYMNKLDKKKSKSITDKTMRIIIFSLKYIDLEELPNLLIINKEYNKVLTKIIYKNLLIKLCKELDISKHLLIWKILLNYTETTIKYNYDEIKEKIYYNPKNVKNKEIIENDIISFDSYNKLNQNKIRTILIALSYILPEINYSKGMSYIAAFLLNITNNEEESFYLFLSLLITTEYPKLIENNQEKIHKYFYVFDRLICILLPELYYHFQENNISAKNFVKPWLISLFTHIFNTIKDRNNPLILLRIIDLFIFSGWKSIIKIGIYLLKNYELKLLNLTTEELINYLNKGIFKNIFFQNEYYDDLMRIIINFKIDNYLIRNVENEFELKEYLPKNGEKDIFEEER